MNESPKGKYDLEERTCVFAERVRVFTRALNKTYLSEDCKQLIKSSGSVAANYIEANEALSRKDFFHRIKICRKEAKESKLWLRLIIVEHNVALLAERDRLTQEATELTKIFGAIVSREKPGSLGH